MAYIDLLAYTRDNKALRDIEVFGYIKKEIDTPTNLEEGLGKEGHFYVMGVYCVNLSSHAENLKELGMPAPDSIYYVNGDICVYSLEVREGWLSCTGDLRCGTKERSNYLCMFNFCKVRGKWSLKSNEFDSTNKARFWSDDCACKLSFIDSRDSDTVLRPTFVEELPKFSGELPYDYVGVQKATEEVPEITVPLNYKPNTEIKTRLEIAPYSELAGKLQGNLDVAKKRLDNHLKALFLDYGEVGFAEETQMLSKILRNLHSSERRRQGYYTGQGVIGKYLDTFGGCVRKHYCGSTVRKVLSSMLGEITDFVEKRTKFDLTGVAEEVAYEAFGDTTYFLAGVMGIITGISTETLTSVAKLCERNKLSFAKIVSTDPYLFQNIGGLSYNDMTKLAIVMGVYNQLHTAQSKHIALLDAFITDTSRGSTYFTEKDIYSLGDYLTETQYKACVSHGSTLNDKIEKGVIAYLGTQVSSINVGQFRRCGAGYRNYISTQAKETAIKAYELSGVGVKYEDYLMSTSTLKKELFVYNALYNMGKEPTKVNKEDIEAQIALIEQELPFELEEQQKQAPLLLLHGCGCLTGGAGSGKTTTVDLMVKILKALDKESKLKFATPTGKSAKRLQEVIGESVRTMHSLFSTSGDGGSILLVATDDDKKGKLRGITFFIDETAMVPLDLLYACLKKQIECKFYFVGDIRQLPPIGKGLPFKNMLKFLPTVALNVSKRAKEGSNITLNANLITDNSEATNWADLVHGDDFFMGQCRNEELPLATYNVCKHYLGKCTPEESIKLASYFGWKSMPELNVTADDIMVISPFVKNQYTWGTTSLNKILQPLFNENKNPHDVYISGLTKSKFIKGDRVVHTESNMYGKQWYEQTPYGFDAIDGCGIANGEVGKIIGLFDAETTQINTDHTNHVTRYPDSMQDDGKWGNSFLAVEYKDYIDGGTFVILYRVERDYNAEGDGNVLKGDELKLLNLFYAGSVHKMQGSQEKLIIGVLGDANCSGFITRNLMYTLYTRGSKLVFALGSVGKGHGSMLSIARKDLAEEHINTIGELLNNA